jgi:urease alpha subunit
VEEGRAGAARTQDDTALATGIAPPVASQASLLCDALGCQGMTHSLSPERVQLCLLPLVTGLLGLGLCKMTYA